MDFASSQPDSSATNGLTARLSPFSKSQPVSSVRNNPSDYVCVKWKWHTTGDDRWRLEENASGHLPPTQASPWLLPLLCCCPGPGPRTPSVPCGVSPMCSTALLTTLPSTVTVTVLQSHTSQSFPVS